MEPSKCPKCLRAPTRATRRSALAELAASPAGRLSLGMATAIRGMCVTWFARGALLAGVGGGLPACSQANDTSASRSPDASRAGALSGTGTVTGKVVSLPVSGSVPACELGYAHPSVCCEPAPYQSAECVEDSDAPFRSCGHWLTFPDARTCCSLAGSKTCTAPMPVSARGSTVDCDLPCGPGGYLPDDPLADAGPVGMPDCADDPMGFCAACCYGMFSETGSNPTTITPVVCSAIISSQGGPASRIRRDRESRCRRRLGSGLGPWAGGVALRGGRPGAGRPRRATRRGRAGIWVVRCARCMPRSRHPSSTRGGGR